MTMTAALKSTKQAKNAKGFGAVKIYETLRSEILSLVLEPSQLIDEVSIAARFKVSRSPVREALVRLATESLLQTLPNKGTIVAPLRIEEFPQYVDALDLLRPIYEKTAAYGHFGREEPEFTWERTDKASALRAAAGLK